MTLKELDSYFRSFLRIEDYPSDPSLNGIQIQNDDPCGTQISKVAFAVDACEESALAAVKSGAQLLFVHHGLFWGGCEPVVGNVYKRYSVFIKNNLALFACHLPLDANNPCGNNYGLAARIGLSGLQPFGQWRGATIGVKGELKEAVSLHELEELALGSGVKAAGLFPFGKEKIRTVGIISGGAGEDVVQAVEDGLDAYITGEVEHEMFHFIKESGINVIAGGHYSTETVGVNLVCEKLRKEKKIETIFIDIPTGL